MKVTLMPNKFPVTWKKTHWITVLDLIYKGASVKVLIVDCEHIRDIFQ